ncbi:transmembrane protein 53-B-like protein [Dinothrombium tinctorium]|uniref:Transmembrane protein 53-B-like protein n=1 Tax=Dinothrombium tinctorium TaxID=1965070 RepID=A0A3S3PC25_9ACAR|nr:transmembrane protein 53-B-like protein [Dinothrombium tinctorium]RWS12228.1 transmembrane protein 53-B-like protein [Dinothrombium tinctorium]RWS15311.1 transmembrane protein 53-B-like protein [Dinothrombium tinctorium]
MSLRYCNALMQTNATLQSNAKQQNLASTRRRLVILMAWMMAKEHHLEKYRKLYFRHGFDVLTVRTSPLQLMFPKNGSQKIAFNLLDYLKSQVSQYPNIVIHGFSVGAYQFGELILRMNRELDNSREIDAKCHVVRENIKGLVFDSAVDLEGVPYGFSRALVGNSPFASILELALRNYMRLFYNISTRHYENSSNAFYNISLRCPALLLVSRNDRTENLDSNLKVAKKWREIGIDVSLKCWDDSRHVGHLIKYPEDYASEIDNFLKKIDLNGV